MSDLFKTFQQIANLLANNHKEGDRPQDTIERLIKQIKNTDPEKTEILEKTSDAINNLTGTGDPKSEPKPVPDIPIPEPQSTPRYKFKIQASMHEAMTKIFGQNWVRHVDIYNTLPSLYGASPTDPGIQNELHRIFTSLTDNAFASLNIDGRHMSISRAMIEVAE